MARVRLAPAEMVKAMQELSVGSPMDFISRQGNAGYDKALERHQQISMAISGQAGNVMAWSDPIDVGFDIYFHCAPGNRDSSLIVPHFTYGVVLTTPAPVVIACHVQSWDKDGNLTVQGAKIVWGCHDPNGAGALTPFNGSIHMNFQGYGAAPDLDASFVEDDLGASANAPDPVTSGDTF